MKPSGTLEQRIEAHLRARIGASSGDEAPFYTFVRAPDKAVVVETQKPGEARVECNLPDGQLCVQWNLQKTGLFLFLKAEKNADGALLVWRDDGTEDGIFHAHVLECKKTVDQSKWEDILQQLRWTFSRLRSISGALGVPLGQATFYTAFRSDSLSSDSSRNPGLLRSPITSRHAAKEEDGEMTDARRRQLDWQNEEISLRGFAGRFVHKQVRLNELGNGSVDIAAG